MTANPTGISTPSTGSAGTTAAKNGANAPTAPQTPAPQQAALSPEMLARIAAMRSQIQISVGQVVLAIMNLTRYRHQSLGDLAHLVIEPLLRDRVAIAHKAARAGDGAAPAAGGQLKAQGIRVDEDTIAGIAIWATVSEAVDAKIADQVRAGTFPVRLAPDDWVSGDTVWLLDVIAADRRQATAVLANFRQLAGERPIRIHPMVARLIEPEVLEKQKRSAASEPSPPAK